MFIKKLRIALTALVVTVAFSGCPNPNIDLTAAGSNNLDASGIMSKTLNDADWTILAEEDGTIKYSIPAAKMPDVKLYDQLIHGGTELREIVCIMDKTADTLTVHTVDSDISRVFPADSNLTIDSQTMTATIETGVSGGRGISVTTMPLTLNQVIETNADGSRTIIWDKTKNRSIDLLDVNKSFSIINIDKNFTQTLFNVSGSGTTKAGNGTISYNGSAKLTLEETLRIKANFNLRLYLNYDCGIRTVRHSKKVWGVTIVWYTLDPWQEFNKNLKASVSGEVYASAYANLVMNGNVTGSYEAPLPFALTFNFAVGVVPVEITYKPSLSVAATVNGNLNATMGGYLGASGEVGVQCTNSGWSAINTFSSSSGYTAPTISASASISVVPKVKNEVRLGVGFANTGVYGTVTLSPYVALKASAGLSASQRTWNISFGLTGDVGVAASLVGKDLGSYNKQVLNISKVISSGTY